MWQRKRRERDRGEINKPEFSQTSLSPTSHTSSHHHPHPPPCLSPSPSWQIFLHPFPSSSSPPTPPIPPSLWILYRLAHRTISLLPLSWNQSVLVSSVCWVDSLSFFPQRGSGNGRGDRGKEEKYERVFSLGLRFLRVRNSGQFLVWFVASLSQSALFSVFFPSTFSWFACQNIPFLLFESMIPSQILCVLFLFGSFMVHSATSPWNVDMPLDELSIILVFFRTKFPCSCLKKSFFILHTETDRCLWRSFVG